MRPAPIEWTTQFQLIAHVQRERDKLRAGVIVQPSASLSWGAAAFEIPDSLDVEELLAHHKHRLIGKSYRSERAAKLAGEKFLRAWLASGESIADVECDCHVEPRRRRRVAS